MPHQHVREREEGRGAAHVLLHVEHAGFGLDVEPAGVETHALADQRDLGMSRIAPADVDEPRRALGGAADRVDERKVFGEEVLAHDRAHAGAVAARQRAGGMFEIGRAHVIGRRVDEVARERDALDDAGEVVAIDAHRQFELDGFVFGFPIAREAVAAERKRQRSEARVVRRIGEAVDARRQKARERARAETVEVGIIRGFEREQDDRERALRPWQQQVPAGTRLKAGGIGKGTGVGVETRAQVRPCRSGDERHGYGSGSLPAQEEDRMNRSLCHEISATTPVTPGASRPGWAGFLTVLLRDRHFLKLSD